MVIPTRNGCRGFCHAVTEFDIYPNAMEEKGQWLVLIFAPPQGIILICPPSNERSLESTSFIGKSIAFLQEERDFFYFEREDQNVFVPLQSPSGKSSDE